MRITSQMMHKFFGELRGMVSERAVDINDALAEHGEDWFSLALKIRCRAVNDETMETETSMSFSKGKIKASYRDIVDAKQLPVFPDAE